MTMPLRHWALSALLAVLLMPTATAASPTQGTGIYASVSGLYVMPKDSSVKFSDGDFRLSGDVAMEHGFGLLAAVGYETRFRKDTELRGEIELGFRTFDFDKAKDFRLNVPSLQLEVPIDDVAQSGEQSTWSLMANGSVSLGRGRLRPYIGAGAGLARHDVEIPSETFEFDGTRYETPKISENDIVLAYQAMSGIDFAVMENMDLRLGYRYFATADADFDGVDVSYGTHNLEGGVLFRF